MGDILEDQEEGGKERKMDASLLYSYMFIISEVTMRL